jgi:YD repeat-containing protein
VFDYVNIRGSKPHGRIADCYGHSVYRSGQVGPTRYYNVYFVEYCPSGYGGGYQPVPDKCARVVPECPYPKVENPTTHVCEDPPCPPKTISNVAGTACIPLAEPKPRNSPPPSCPSDLAAGNPIYPLRGVKREEVDVGVRIGGLTVKFIYDTTLRLQVNNAYAGSLEPGVLGTAGWYSNLYRKLIVQSRGEVIHIDRGDGYRVAFRAEGEGFVPTNGHLDRLESVSGEFRYYDSRQHTEEVYGADGKVRSIHWAAGKRITFIYSVSDGEVPAGFLTEVQDDAGRSLRLRYDISGRLSQLIDAQGESYRLAYGSNALLSVITLPDNRTREFLYGDSRHYWALTNVQNEYRNTNAWFSYDDAGRVIGTAKPNNADRYAVSYVTPPAITSSLTYDSARDVMVRDHEWIAPSGTTLTDPLGRTLSVGAALVAGKSVMTSQSQPAGAGCAASTRSQGYDPVGNIQHSDDFNGQRTCYAHDLSRQLEIARIEGLSQTTDCTAALGATTVPMGARKVTTQWHPDWRIAAKVAEPGKITHRIYAGQPDPFAGSAIANCAPPAAQLPSGKRLALLCKLVEQATTDVDGRLGFSAGLQANVSSRITTWTYNERGQVLTENGPRTDLTDTTTYTYYTDITDDHMPGDVATIANAMGHVTRHTKYNRYGHLLESVDPNGALTVNVYDLRQRLVSKTVSGLTTTYQYDRMGRLTRVTRSDNSWIGYDYDSASRLTSVFDNLGNRVDYTLDNAGNRTRETTRDPNGALKRQLSRSIDALGRVQQTIGRE